MINRILIIAILLFMSCDEEVVSSESVYGCTDEAACNFDSNATVYVPNSCDCELGSGQALSTTIFLRRHLGDYYEECYDDEGCETIATTNEQGYFEFSQNCLGFDSSFTQTDAEGNQLGIVSVPRRLKLFADTGEAYGSTDFFVVYPQSGAEININIDNE